MKFVSLREFRTRTAEMRKTLAAEHEIVLTANGKPFALVSEVGEDDFEQRLKALRRSRADVLLDTIHAEARAKGLDKLTMDDIDAMVAQARRERRSAK